MKYQFQLKCRKVHQASWHHIPEDNKALVQERDKLKSHIPLTVLHKPPNTRLLNFSPVW